eukprot:919598-Alexandrium_andersonii.AAC.1
MGENLGGIGGASFLSHPSGSRPTASADPCAAARAARARTRQGERKRENPAADAPWQGSQAIGVR